MLLPKKNRPVPTYLWCHPLFCFQSDFWHALVYQLWAQREERERKKTEQTKTGKVNIFYRDNNDDDERLMMNLKITKYVLAYSVVLNYKENNDRWGIYDHEVKKVNSSCWINIYTILKVVIIMMKYKYSSSRTLFCVWECMHESFCYTSMNNGAAWQVAMIYWLRTFMGNIFFSWGEGHMPVLE